MFKTFKQHLNNSTNWKVSNINYGLLKLTWTHRNTLSLLTLQQLPPPIKFKPSANLSTLTTNKGHGPQVWLLKTNTYVFNIDSSFYVPTFICRPCKHSHKQNGTMWLQRTYCKQPIKRRQENKCSVFIGGLRDDQWSSQGLGKQTATMLCRQEGGFIRSTVNQLTLPQEGWWAMWEQASIVFAGRIYCSNPPDCVITQWSVHQITLGQVTAPCIRFTALYIHLLSRVKNSGSLNNWIKWM